jgi:hypothetical protein
LFILEIHYFNLELEEEPAELEEEIQERQVRHAATFAACAAATKEEEEGNGAGQSGPTFVNPINFFIWSARKKIVLMLSYLIYKCGGLRPPHPQQQQRKSCSI